MSRTVVMGKNSQYVESAVSVGQYNNSNEDKAVIPNDISDDQWKEFLCFIENFLKSKEAQELKLSEHSKIKDEFNLAKEKSREEGWLNFRELFGDFANTVTIATPLVTYVSSNQNQIAEWICNLF